MSNNDGSTVLSPDSAGYYQTEWPKRTRAYEYGVYTDQVLQNTFMPGMAVLTNLSAQ